MERSDTACRRQPEGQRRRALATVPDQFTACPAISNGRIYLRGYESLYAIGVVGK